MNVIDILGNNAKLFANSLAIIDVEKQESLTYQQLWNKIEAIASGLHSLGLKAGDRVVIFLPNSPEFIICYLAVLRIAALAVPLNTQLKSSEIAYVLSDTAAKAIIGEAAELITKLDPIRDSLQELEFIVQLGRADQALSDTRFEDWLKNTKVLSPIDIEEEAPAAIHYSSGSTGRIKGAILSHKNIAYNALLNGHYVLSLNDLDRVLGLSPFCHVFFFLVGLGPLCAGATVMTVPRASIKLALTAIEKYKVTHLAGVPTIFRYLLKRVRENPRDLSSLRVVGSAGSSMEPELIAELQRLYKVEYFEAYGCTETSSTVTYSRLRHYRSGSVGKAAHGYEIRLLNESGTDAAPGEVGEIMVKGQGVFKGYWGQTDAEERLFTEDGWYRTGDLARQDQEGYLYLVGRRKEVIITGGFNVYPKMVEDTLLSHPDIEEAAVIGVPHESMGEIPVGYVVLKPGAYAKVTQEDIIGFCLERMVKYRVPKRIVIISNFPRTHTGKINKASLRNLTC